MMFVEIRLKFKFLGFILGFSKFFGPSPRKQRLTVYRGIQVRQKLCINLRWLFDNIFGLTYSFELASFVNLDMVSLLLGISAGSFRKSILERLGDFKVRPLDGILIDFMIRGH